MAINHPIQGTASDIVKIAMIEVQKLIDERTRSTLMVLQVHDELLFEIRRDDLDGFASDLCPIMQNAMTLEVPLVVDLRRRQLGGDEGVQGRRGGGAGVPELPEVESLRRDLEETLVGRRFTLVDVRLPKQVVTPTGLTVADLIGKRIGRLPRRAKFLIFDLSDGLALVFHLRLAGPARPPRRPEPDPGRGRPPGPRLRRAAPAPLDARHLPLRRRQRPLSDRHPPVRAGLDPPRVQAVQPLLDRRSSAPSRSTRASRSTPSASGSPGARRCRSSRSCSTSRSSAGSATSTPTRSSSRAS